LFRRKRDLRTAQCTISREDDDEEQSLVIERDQLMLRATSEQDLPDLRALWNDGRVMRWVGFPDGLDYDAAAMSRWYDRLRADPRRHHFVIEHPDLGFCGEAYYATDAAGRAGLDIKLRPAAQGRGIAATALRALIAHVFRVEPHVDEVWAEPARANAAARRLYARCGLRPRLRPVDLPPGESYWALRRDAAGCHDPPTPRCGRLS
jgi:RimJ/RimL family protein N-acetyltransferase